MIEKSLRDVPHFELIRENETIKVFSIFDFTGGAEKLFPFLYGCRKMNCAVIFENEAIMVKPDGNRDSTQNLLLSFYAMVAKDPKIASDYIRYLTAKCVEASQ